MTMNDYDLWACQALNARACFGDYARQHSIHDMDAYGNKLSFGNNNIAWAYHEFDMVLFETNQGSNAGWRKLAIAKSYDWSCKRTLGTRELGIYHIGEYNDFPLDAFTAAAKRTLAEVRGTYNAGKFSTQKQRKALLDSLHAINALMEINPAAFSDDEVELYGLLHETLTRSDASRIARRIAKEAANFSM